MLHSLSREIRVGWHKRRSRFFRPRVELLEDRLAPSIFVVTTTADTNLNRTANPSQPVSLRDAINAANTSGGHNSVVLQQGQTYQLNTVDNFWYGPNGLPAIASNLTVQGNGATIQRVGTSAFRIFYISGGLDTLSPGQLTLDDLTLQDGLARGGNGGNGGFGGGGGAGLGGAIFNQGTLDLVSVTLTANVAQGGNGGSLSTNFYQEGGGGGLGGNGGNGGPSSATGGGGGGGFEGDGATGTAAAGGAGGSGLQGQEGGQGGSAGGFGSGGSSSYGGAGSAATSGGTGGGGGGFRPGDNAYGTQGGGSGGLGGDGGDAPASGRDGGGGGFGGSVYANGVGITMPGGGGAFGGGGGGGWAASGGGGGGVGGGGGAGSGYSDGGGGGFGGGGGSSDLSGGAGGFGGGGGSCGEASGGGSGGFAGGAGGTVGFGGGGGAGLGGALFNLAGTVYLFDCNLMANSALGGNGGSGAQGGGALGGALFNLNGTVTLINDTFAQGTATAGASAANSGSDTGLGTDIYNLTYGNDLSTGNAVSAALTLNNVILASGAGASVPGLVNNQENGNHVNAASLNVSGPSLSLYPVDNVGGSGTVSNPGALTVGSPGLGTFLKITDAPAQVGAVGGMSQNTPIGSAYGTLLQAEVTDAFGNPLPDVPVTFTAPAGGASGTFNALATVPTNALGIATAPAFTANHTSGSFNVTATVAGVGSPASLSLTNTAVPAAIVPVAGTMQHALVTGAYAPLRARVTDTGGNPVSGITVVFALPATGPGGTFAGSAAVLTNANGVAVAPPLTANQTSGAFTVTAWVAGVFAPARFLLTNTPGAAKAVNAFLGTPQSATVARLYTTPLQAQVVDAFGNGVRGVRVTFTAPATGAGATFAGNRTVTALTGANGVATAPLLTANTRAGTFTVTASAGGLGTPAAFQLTNVPGPVARIVPVAGSTPQSAAINVAFAVALAVKVTDAFGNAESGLVVTYTVRPNARTGSQATFSGGGLTATATTGSNGLTPAAPALTADADPGTFTAIASIAGVLAQGLFTLTIT